MTRTNWMVGIFLSLLLIGGFALDVSAQQPTAPPAPAESTQTPAPQSDSKSDSSAQPAQPAPPPSTNNTQIETRTERTERVIEQPGKFLGVDATVAMIIGAVLVIVVVIGLVAMSRRGDGVRERETHETTHTRTHV